MQTLCHSKRLSHQQILIVNLLQVITVILEFGWLDEKGLRCHHLFVAIRNIKEIQIYHSLPKRKFVTKSYSFIYFFN